MAPPKVMSGARAKVAIYDPTLGPITIGIWNDFSYSVNYDVQPAFILGAYAPVEISTTGVEPVSITASGWRVVNHGPFTTGRLTPLQTLLKQEYLILTVIDRQTGLSIAIIHDCIPTGTSTTLSSRQLQTSSNTYMGRLMQDEDVDNAEDSTAATFP